MKQQIVSMFMLGVISFSHTNYCTQAKKGSGAQTNSMVQPTEIWTAMKHKPAYSKAELQKVFINQIDHLHKLHGNLDKSIPQHVFGKGTLRIVTYNVHDFKDPAGKQNFWGMYDVLKAIDADVIILQEAVSDDLFKKDKSGHNVLRDRFTKLGYSNGSFVGGARKSAHFGNCIISKYKFACKPYKRNFNYKGNIHKRSFVKVEIDLSKWKKAKLALYGTHFQVSDPSLRLEEARELVYLADKYDQHKNVIIAADFNETRKGQALQVLEKSGFVDSFSLAKLQEPYFTHWSGNSLDYLYFKNQDLWVSGSYLYYDNSSDHMPVIMDIELK